MRKPYLTDLSEVDNLIVWQEPDPGPNTLHAAFTR
jgi:hypothetical protein